MFCLAFLQFSLLITSIEWLKMVSCTLPLLQKNHCTLLDRLCVLLEHLGAQCIIPDWGDKVDFGIELLYRPVRLHRLAGLVRQPYAIVDFFLQSETMNLATVATCAAVPPLWHRRLIVLF